MSGTDFEKLGVFYLGRRYDLEARRPRPEELVLYDAKDLVTHAVCVGMTGSGKTGLCVSLLEEAAIDGIPVLAIDPKGDLGNLLLAFPELAPEDFEPWVDAAQASREGITPRELAAREAERVRAGLAEHGQTKERIRKLRDAADVTIYTPGSEAGVPLSIVRSFAAPPPEVREDRELLRERVASSVTGLLGLLGIDADPLQSREHVFLSTLVERAWRAGDALDLAALIAAAQRPPFDKVGVLDLETFYPAKERAGLVTALNGLLASPAFASWLEGEPLDVARMLMTDAGKPRIAIVSIAHLDDAQRMFFVSLLLGQVLSWMRAQSGTTSLRAILYMDEIFGYFPPVAEPPSKRPLLTLLKQARAFGLGVVLATQNPVDLDYKGLSNAGTWLVGRLQTERDKLRVLDGLEGAMSTAGAGFDRARMDAMLAGLGKRVFLLHNVHEPEPVVFETRFALSYLRGPLSRAEVKRLMEDRRATAQPSERADTAQPAAAAPVAASATTTGRPVLPPEVPQHFLPIRRAPAGGGAIVYRPMVLGVARVPYVDAKLGVDVADRPVLLAPVDDSPIPLRWAEAHAVDVDPRTLSRESPASGTFLDPPASARQPKRYATFAKDLVAHLAGTYRVELWKSPSTKLVSRAGEGEAAFRLRLSSALRERRDAEVEKLRRKLGPKVATLDERIRRARAAVERERAEATRAEASSAFDIGSALLGVFGARSPRSAAAKVRSAGRAAARRSKAQADAASAAEQLESLARQRRTLLEELERGVAAIDASTADEALERVAVRPKKSAIEVELLSLVWAPYLRGEGAVAEPAF